MRSVVVVVGLLLVVGTLIPGCSRSGSSTENTTAPSVPPIAGGVATGQKKARPGTVDTNDYPAPAGEKTGVKGQ